MHYSITAWVIFVAIVVFLLLFDLGVLHRKDHEIGIRESLLLSAGYILIALLYGVGIWFNLGVEKASLYFTGFLVEKTLSLDNIFLISLILTQLHIPRIYQYRVLFYGILGAIILRGIMIGLGAVIISKFSWVLDIFAVFLILTGIKMLFIKEKSKDVSQSHALLFLKRWLPLTHEIHGHDFWVKLPDPENPKHKKRYYTPLFVALCLIEFTDIIFAVDSIPAIFAITTDPYIVYTSNIFAILGLRALFFAVHAILHRFEYLKYALALVLIFICSKVFIVDWFGLVKFPASISLGVTACLILGGILLSLYKTKRTR